MSDEFESLLERRLTRASLLKTGAVGGAAVVASAYWRQASAFAGTASRAALPSIKGQHLVWPGYGGPYDEIIQAKVHPLFEKETGCKATVVPGPDSAKLLTMIKNKNVSWDLWPGGPDLPPSIYGKPNPYWLPIDYKVVTNARQLPSSYRFTNMAATDGYSLGIVWRKDQFPNGGPQTWVDVWDVKKFPGMRALPRRAADIMDIARMASGTPASSKSFYPMNITAMVDKIKEIKPNVAKFWTGGEEPMQLLLSGEVAIAGVWLSRVVDPVKQGAPIDFTWNQNIFRIAGFSIVRGTKYPDAAQQYLNFRLRPQIQAIISNGAAIAYTVPGTTKYIKPKSQLSHLPSAPQNVKVQHLSAGKYWVDNETTVDKQLTAALGI
jgi:putative spermidine/putrescine transport system substrate-binding protein